jgi:hypothetical protein
VYEYVEVCKIYRTWKLLLSEGSHDRITTRLVWADRRDRIPELAFNANATLTTYPGKEAVGEQFQGGILDFALLGAKPGRRIYS